MTIRTSTTHPLQIAEIQVAPGMGCVGVTFCPGKHQRDGMTGSWERDLGLDVDHIADWSAAAVVTLVEDHELEALNVSGLGEAVIRRHMLWRHLPVPDATAPGPDFEEAWNEAGPGIRHILRNGFNVLIHCKGGLGRAGTIAARILVELGWRPIDAIQEVRRIRPGAIETEAQKRHVEQQSEYHDLVEGVPGSQFDRALGALVGLSIGDALGTTLEFQPRDSKPLLTDMVGGGVFKLSAGQWTDDTAMALALADSLITHHKLDPRDLADRFCLWMQKGHYSCTGTCFDIGNATSSALQRYLHDGNPLAGSPDPNSAGNGSLMRLAPIVLHHLSQHSDETSLRELARRQSQVTHAAAACLDSCSSFAALLAAIIDKPDFQRALAGLDSPGHKGVAGIVKGSWRGKHRRNIQSSGYVLHSLETAIWCVARTTNFAEAVLLAANLGDDADTTAAITGQLAGALYGLEGIRQDWIAKLAWSDRIQEFGHALLGFEGNIYC